MAPLSHSKENNKPEAYNKNLSRQRRQTPRKRSPALLCLLVCTVLYSKVAGREGRWGICSALGNRSPWRRKGEGHTDISKSPPPFRRDLGVASESATAAEVSSYGIGAADQVETSIKEDTPPLNLTEVALMDLPGLTKGKLYDRSWFTVGDDVKKSRRSRLRVLQFNVLADCLTTGSNKNHLSKISKKYSLSPRACPGKYGVVKYCQGPIRWKSRMFLCGHEHLNWKARFPVLLREIVLHKPDLICLQEVDRYEEFKAYLASKGYSGRFVKKSHRALDGCAVFWKISRIEIIDSEPVTLHAENVHVAIMLRMRFGNRTFVVVNTHLKAGLEQPYEDFRVEQLKCLLERVKDFQRKNEDIVLCGDLNAHIETYDSVKALAYPFLKQCGFLNAYGQYPLYTHWGGWIDCEVKVVFDYILYLGNIKVVKILEMPSEDVISSSPERLPNNRYPSDHMSLVADLEFTLPPPPDPSQKSSPTPLQALESHSFGKLKPPLFTSKSPRLSHSLPVHNPSISLSSISNAIKFILHDSGSGNNNNDLNGGDNNSGKSQGRQGSGSGSGSRASGCSNPGKPGGSS
ncbi:hypothetical protein AAMO2058_000438500 [Amorphochlora amoebiformis]